MTRCCQDTTITTTAANTTITTNTTTQFSSPKGKYGRAAPPLVGDEGDFCTLCKPGRYRDLTGAVDDQDCLECTRTPTTKSYTTSYT